jgi:hypothetical protein
MSTAISRVATAHASRYLQQLCKHWGHKFPVTFTPQNGRIELPTGICILDADAEGLDLRLEAPTDVIARMQDVVAEHLQRFAFKEELRFQWVEAA